MGLHFCDLVLVSRCPLKILEQLIWDYMGFHIGDLDQVSRKYVSQWHQLSVIATFLVIVVLDLICLDLNLYCASSILSLDVCNYIESVVLESSVKPSLGCQLPGLLGLAEDSRTHQLIGIRVMNSRQL